jgi:hypothetical protein
MTSHDDLIEELRREIENMQQALEESPAAPGLIPLKIKCLMASCANGHHSLNYTKPHVLSGPIAPGTCRDCGEHVLELPHRSDLELDDPSAVLDLATKQQSELMRAHYWRVPFDKKAYNQALRLGRLALEEKAARKVEKNLQDLTPFGRLNAPYSGDIIAYAQHATATCCRDCASYWHGFPHDGRLSDQQVKFAVHLAVSYLAARLPELPDEPAQGFIPGVRSADFIGADEAQAVEVAIRSAVERGVDPAGLLMPLGTQLSISASRLGDGTGYVKITHPDDDTLF